MIFKKIKSIFVWGDFNFFENIFKHISVWGIPCFRVRPTFLFSSPPRHSSSELRCPYSHTPPLIEPDHHHISIPNMEVTRDLAPQAPHLRKIYLKVFAALWAPAGAEREKISGCLSKIQSKNRRAKRAEFFFRVFRQNTQQI